MIVGHVKGGENVTKKQVLLVALGSATGILAAKLLTALIRALLG